jgi:hypothetical protein
MLQYPRRIQLMLDDLQVALSSAYSFSWPSNVLTVLNADLLVAWPMSWLRQSLTCRDDYVPQMRIKPCSLSKYLAYIAAVGLPHVTDADIYVEAIRAADKG